MASADLEADLSQGSLRPVYLLHGPNLPLRDKLLRKVMDLVPEGLRDFNLQTLSADETPPLEVARQAMTLPIMSALRVVILRGVDHYSADDQARLLDYVQDPNDQACLVMTADKPDFKTRLFKGLRKLGYEVELSAPKGKGLISWIRKYMTDRGRKISPEAAEVLVDRIGEDVVELESELEKLWLFTLGRDRVEADDVRQASRVGQTANVFQLGDAVGGQDPGRALAALKDLLVTGHHLPVLAMLVRHFRLLLKAKAAAARRLPKAEAAKALGLPPFIAGKYLEQAGRLSTAEIKKGLIRLQEANLTLVTTSTPERLVMDGLVLDLASLKRG